MTMNPRRPYFNDLAPRWDTFPVATDAPARIREFLRRSARVGARRILDVGCGTGILLPYLAEAYPSETVIVEFDLAEAMLREGVCKFPSGRVLRVCGDAQNLPFQAASFDLVLCFSVMPHLGDAGLVTQNLFRALRLGGVFTVGHLSASKELNEFHHAQNGPIQDDMLLPARDLGSILCRLGAAVVCAEEGPDSYFVRAERTNP